MRFLKQKVAATQARLARLEKSNKETIEKPVKIEVVPKPVPLKKSITKKPKAKANSRKMSLVTKNIIKNYGRAIANFASSDLSLPYIESYCKKHPLDVEKFIDYCLIVRDQIQSIETFKDAFISYTCDTPEVMEYKKLFQELAVVFMKYFSVNWIFQGKMLYKEDYLKFRGALIRRIQDPDSFIYLHKKK